MIAGWFLEDNLKPVLELIATRCGTSLDADDWTALRFRLEETDCDRDKWYDYQFTGKFPAKFRLARNPGSAVISVRIESDADVERSCRVILDIASVYYLYREPK